MSKRFMMILAVVAVFAAGSTAEAAEWKTKWSNGHKVESDDGAFALKFGGRIQADYTQASGDDAIEGDLEDGFEFRRARLFFEGDIYEKVSFKAQYDFAGGEASFKDVWIALAVGPGDLQFGHFKEPFSLEELTSSKYLAFMERSLPVEAFAPSRNSGVGYSASSGDRFNWGVGAFYDADDFGVSTDEDAVNITGRLGFRPLYEDEGRRMIHLGIAATRKDIGDGASFRFRARPEAHFTTRFVNTNNFAADSSTILGAEVAGVFDRFWFASEYIQNDVDSPVAGDPTFDGLYAQAGFFLTPGDYRRFKTSSGSFDRQKPSSVWGMDEGGTGAWEIAARYSTVDLSDQGINGGEQDNYTLGLNWYPNPATRLMINYVHADIQDLAEADFFMLRWQVDF